MDELKPVFDNAFQSFIVHELNRIAQALEQIAENTKPEKDEELQPKIKGFDTGNTAGKENW